MHLNGHRQGRVVAIGGAGTVARPSLTTAPLSKDKRLSGTTTDSPPEPVPQNDQGDRYGSE